MANKGLFGDRISEVQYNYLADNIEDWYNDYTVVFSNNTFSSVFVDWYDSATGYYEMDTITRDGAVNHSRSNDPNNYRATVWNGEPGGYLYFYGDNGYVEVSSVVTLNLAIYTERPEKDLIRYQETNLNIFEAISEVLGENQIWSEDPEYLDELYTFDHSGQKWISGVVYRYLYVNDDGEYVLSESDRHRIARIILAKYANNWARLYATTQQNYNILDDYRKVDTHSGTDTHTETPEDWKTTTTQTPTDWKTTVEGTETDNNGENENMRYGFNSTNPVNVDKSSSKVNSKTEQTQSGSFETEVEQTGTKTTETEYGHVITTEGHVKYSPQDLIEQERELWKYDYFNTVMVDIDKILCLSIY